jgi:hypothetical protein
MDTSSFGVALILTGVRKLQDIPYLRANPSVVIPVAKLPEIIRNDVPEAFHLYQNYPNPFNPITTIEFTLPQDGIVNLKLYNLLGQEVLTVISSEIYEAGMFDVEIDASNLASGVYFYRLVVSGINPDADPDEPTGGKTFSETKRMILLK